MISWGFYLSVRDDPRVHVIPCAPLSPGEHQVTERETRQKPLPGGGLPSQGIPSRGGEDSVSMVVAQSARRTQELE